MFDFLSTTFQISLKGRINLLHCFVFLLSHIKSINSIAYQVYFHTIQMHYGKLNTLSHLEEHQVSDPPLIILILLE